MKTATREEAKPTLTPASTPIQLFDLELSRGVPSLAAHGYASSRIFCKAHGRPLGWVSLKHAQDEVIPAERIRSAVREQLEDELLAYAFDQAIRPESAPPEEFPAISVVVCTRDRTTSLQECLQSLLALDYPHFEIIVVDNAPATTDTADLCASLPVHYVREDRPGLNRARNRGLAEARFPMVAFIDDDAQADPAWLKTLARNFCDPTISAVTGMVIPSELETPAQALFELAFGGMSHGVKTRRITRNSLDERMLLWASNFGVGTNMAFRKEIFSQTGSFDPALDVGTASGGGGDVEMLHRLVAAGHTLLYDPAVLVRHRHRTQISVLQRQVFNNGRSFGCYLFTCWRNRTAGRRAIIKFMLKDWLGGWLIRRLLMPGRFPYRLVVAEFSGALASPFAYIASQRGVRREKPRLAPSQA
jgi:glycosyltransferase involved in cell wall biosynthesis